MSRNAPQLPNNATTGNAITVQTATGFSAGDLVYYKGSTNDYVSPSNLAVPATAPFNINSSQPLASPAQHGFVTPAFGAADVQGSSKTSKSAATLTNGNIVQVVSNNTTYQATFQIVSPTGTVVVAPTSASATFVTSSASANVGVVALTGGGFAMFWVNAAGGTANKPCYAVYSNTGTLVTAAVNDATAGGTFDPGSVINGVSLANGGFALTLTTTVGVIYIRAFGATGTGTYAWTALTPTNNQYNSPVAMAARSDNSVLVFAVLNGNTAYNYAIVNSTGGLIVSNGTFATGSYSDLTAATTLSDGTTFVIAYRTTSASNFTYAYRFIPTGNVLGSEVVLPASNFNLSTTGVSNYMFTSLLGLSAGGFVHAFQVNDGSLQYIVYNSSGVAVSGVNTNGAVPRTVNAVTLRDYVCLTMIENAGDVYMYWQTANYNKIGFNQYGMKVSMTTYNPVPTVPYAAVLGTTTNSVTSLAQSQMTPTKASFLAANTESIYYTVPGNASSVSPSTLATVACDSLDSATMPDGRILILYRNASTYALSMAVLSPAGVLQQTVSIGTGWTGGIAGRGVRVTALPNGKVVVAYVKTSTTVTLAVYSSTFTFLATATQGIGSYSNNDGLAIAGLSNNRIAYFARSSGNAATLTIYNDSLTQLYSTATTGSPGQGFSMAANKAGGFVIHYYDNGGTNYRIEMWYNTSGNNYATSGVSTATYGPASYNIAPVVAVTGGNYIAATIYAVAPTLNMGLMTEILNTSFNRTFGTITVGNQLNTSSAAGITGNGTLVSAFTVNAGNTISITAYPGGITTGASGDATYITFPSTNQLTYTGAFRTTAPGPCFSLAPSYGNQVCFSFLDGSSFPVFMIINAMPYTGFSDIVSGVTTSSYVTISPSGLNASTAVGNSVLSGVALTSATAGGFGVVQTNGSATLNSNYSASTAAQAFDHQLPNGAGVGGVKGAIVGRNVNLQGNN